MITIDEAAKKWSCSKNTVLSYVYKRYILLIDISCHPIFVMLYLCYKY